MKLYMSDLYRVELHYPLAVSYTHLLSFLLLMGCQKKPQLYSKVFTGPFDTITQYMSCLLYTS